MIEFNDSPQGSDDWLTARRGFITASRIKDARDRLKNGAFSARATLYAQDLARERCGGEAEKVFVTAAMRTGLTSEEAALLVYAKATGELWLKIPGFAFDSERMYGCSVDGLVGDDGMIETKTLVGSSSLFRVLVEGDISGYMDQIQFSLHLLEREWCDLVLWTPDFGLAGIRRVLPDPAYIGTMLSDLDEFNQWVHSYSRGLTNALTGCTP